MSEAGVEAAFQALCEGLPRGIFYRRGSFIAFDESAREVWLARLEEASPEPLRDLLQGLMAKLGERGFRGDAPAAASGRVGDMNRFRQLLGALFLALDISRDRDRSMEAHIEGWFSPPPCWLLESFDPAHLARLNPSLARRVAVSRTPEGLLPARTAPQRARQVADALWPLLNRRHLLFWYDQGAREIFCGPKPPGDYPRALAMKLDSAKAEASHEIEALGEALSARAPHNINALVFHLLAWIAWSEPVERAHGRPNPGFEPLLHFIEQICRRKARWVTKRLPKAAVVAEGEVEAELVGELVLMCQADRFRHVINLNAGFRAALDRLGKARLEVARADADEAAAHHSQSAPLDWLVARFAAGDKDRLHNVSVAEKRAEVRGALGRIWERLRGRLAALLEEANPARIRLPAVLRDEIVEKAPALLVALDRAEPQTLVRWYWLEVLALDEHELDKELRLRDLWLGDEDNRRWFEALGGVSPAMQREALREALDRELEEIL